MTERVASTARASDIGFPVSRDSNDAIFSDLDSKESAILSNQLDLSPIDKAAHSVRTAVAASTAC